MTLESMVIAEKLLLDVNKDWIKMRKLQPCSSLESWNRPYKTWNQSVTWRCLGKSHDDWSIPEIGILCLANVAIRCTIFTFSDSTIHQVIDVSLLLSS